MKIGKEGQRLNGVALPAGPERFSAGCCPAPYRVGATTVVGGWNAVFCRVVDKTAGWQPVGQAEWVSVHRSSKQMVWQGCSFALHHWRSSMGLGSPGHCTAQSYGADGEDPIVVAVAAG